MPPLAALPEMTAEAVLPNFEFGDWISVDDVLERCLGNVDLMRRVVGRFRDRLDAACQELQSLTLAGDLPAVASRAHRLKGEAANVGCQRISRQAADVEEFATARLHDAVMLGVDLLATTCSEFLRQTSNPA